MPAKDRKPRVGPTASSDCSAWIGKNVTRGANVRIGPGAVIGWPEDHQARPEDEVHIEADTVIGPSVHVEPGVRIGADCSIGAGTFVGRGTRIGRNVSIGPQCVLIGDCTLEDHVRLIANVYVCEESLVEEFAHLMPGVILINDLYPPSALDVRGPRIGRCAVVGIQSVIFPGVRLGFHALVASRSDVKHDVPDFTCVSGSPAKAIIDCRKIGIKIAGERMYPYPWMRVFAEDQDLSRMDLSWPKEFSEEKGWKNA